MRAEQGWIKPDASDPFSDKRCVLPCCHTPPRHTPAVEQEFAWPLSRSADVVVNGLPGLLRHFESNRLPRFLLADCRSINGIPMWGNVLDLERDDIAGTQLTIDGQIEHRQVACSPLDLELGPDRPDVLWPEWWLSSNQLTFIPRGALGCAWHDVLVVLHGHTPRLLRMTSMRRPFSMPAIRLLSGRLVPGFD
jgi:hypothetical protein